MLDVLDMFDNSRRGLVILCRVGVNTTNADKQGEECEEEIEYKHDFLICQIWMHMGDNGLADEGKKNLCARRIWLERSRS